MKEKLVERFVKYIKFDTQSDAYSQTVPSTPNQVEFAKTILVPELEEIGLSQVKYNESNGFVTALLPSNTDKVVDTIGFIAHMDTADFNGKNINPQFHEQYNGEDIVLNAKENIKLKVSEFPNLKDYKGQTLITTDGTTLLGADDKAGIAEIITAMDYLIQHPEIKHGDIKVAFGPDEEIGRGANLFDVEDFGAKFAYTMDGSRVGELEWESFNAARAEVIFRGKNVHPGTAKDTMINAMSLAADFITRLPKDMVPEKTSGREGFIHLTEMSGSVEEARLVYIIRDHDFDLFEEKKDILVALTSQMNFEQAFSRVLLSIKDEYYNMGEILAKDMTPVHLAEQAMKNLNIPVIMNAIRGGTDGSKLSFMGLPTPNIFAGGENFHGRYEFVAVESMEKATDVIIEICRLLEL
ncbi:MULTISPECIES: peptidase T [unclassified Granulicatella]|uniref:peptidase T n=1 Tax=unclassified Granulicatella TaxID=2630493 RepID=UPI0010735A0E|nr:MULTISPECIES: peptidase T [unclassified Granulicatella]MBF0780442.1 peptidase T [Granulicatella sp. 19428wC4_WM01]TFU95431.1 peptidase T [Granulicatella sp. WM01]